MFLLLSLLLFHLNTVLLEILLLANLASAYLCAAAVAAASMANCLIVLSSRYFCSHLVMSASSARIRSSFSRSCSRRAEELSSVAVRSAAWLWD